MTALFVTGLRVIDITMWVMNEWFITCVTALQIHTYAHTNIRTHIHTHTHTYAHTHIRTHTHTHTHTYAHTYMYHCATPHLWRDFKGYIMCDMSVLIVTHSHSFIRDLFVPSGVRGWALDQLFIRYSHFTHDVGELYSFIEMSMHYSIFIGKVVFICL